MTHMEEENCPWRPLHHYCRYHRQFHRHRRHRCHRQQSDSPFKYGGKDANSPDSTGRPKKCDHQQKHHQLFHKAYIHR